MLSFQCIININFIHIIWIKCSKNWYLLSTKTPHFNSMKNADSWSQQLHSKCALATCDHQLLPDTVCDDWWCISMLAHLNWVVLGGPWGGWLVRNPLMSRVLIGLSVGSSWRTWIIGVILRTIPSPWPFLSGSFPASVSLMSGVEQFSLATSFCHDSSALESANHGLEPLNN